jgi:peptidoglycan LD-endopeptidase LytH
VRRLLVSFICALALPVPVASAWTWPVDGPVLRPFQFDRSHPYAAGQHRGLDIGAEAGARVRAPVGGVVSFAGSVPNGGKTVSIETPSGHTATLVHLGALSVARGARVDEGAVVGAVGPSGTTDLSEPFVYFGVRVTDDEQGYVDPLSFLPVRVTPPPSPQAVPEVAAPAVDPAADELASEPPATPGAGPVAAPVQAAPAAEPGTAPAVAEARQPATSAASAAGGSIDARAVHPPATDSEAPRSASVSQPGRATPLGLESPVHTGASIFEGEAIPKVASTRPATASPEETPLAEVKPARRVSQRSTTSATTAGRSVGLLFLSTLVLAAVLLSSMFVFAARRTGRRSLPRIMLTDPRHVGHTANKEKDPRRAGLAVCGGEASPRPRGGLRSAGRHLRAVPPLDWERRPDGQRDRRAWDASDGHGRSGRRLAA